MLKKLKQLSSKITLRKTIVFDSLKGQSLKKGLLKTAFCDYCISLENVTQLISWLNFLSIQYKRGKDEDILEEVSFLLYNFYISEELKNFCDKYKQSEEMLENSFFDFFGQPQYLITKGKKVVKANDEDIENIKLKKQESSIGLSYFIYDWEEYYQPKFKEMVDKKIIDKQILEQILN